MDENIISEKVKNEIKKLIEESNALHKFPAEVSDLLTQICFEMYKKGHADAFRVMEMSIGIHKKMFS